MQVSNSTSQALNAFKQNSNSGVNSSTTTKQPETKEKSLEEIVNDSATKVTISMNAQYILFEMNASNVTKTNSLAQFGLTGLTDQQSDVLSFLNGGTSDGLTLSDLGYQGKPILQLSQDEATQLVSEDGFFGVTQTSDRVAGFVLSFAGDDLELLQKGREGIVKGFEEAEKLFGGQLPEISYKTQERTLALIDEKIKSLKGEE
ncbi:hydrogenase-4 component G [Aliarcobacter butzleri]|uniref:hydrogenase-4 component G n=1 Tax=Aliarcobacter butzleri TaxID=28197 RepID=UPI0021B23E4F|nr:hydrogenase-4 component G [Aliarcobacter butzleri]MCT7551493.1 hydrogenase-4 component G [Aliarcobacter butzleri]MCT7576242.1 hydrogenase-4 component G [Aliarcobacter butzleri]MCT7582741.1 hydrogenase-4 component G [Aliarcobacter butzleri]MCT7591953.1 hydrogenase-4 component G [Aliarcobacter butzleri]MCT7635506.1 hydrogenase-4 component G [Aliarcobacter butzleri]